MLGHAHTLIDIGTVLFAVVGSTLRMYRKFANRIRSIETEQAFVAGVLHAKGILPSKRERRKSLR